MQRVLAAGAHSSPTWHGDADAAIPSGFHGEVYECLLGHGDATFARGVEAVMTWGVQRGSGLIAHTPNSRVRVGDDIVVGLPAGPFVILAPCRISGVYDSDETGGFRYVTLPGHPEIGHEAFVVERRGEQVWFVVRPVSRPGSALVRAAGPIARLVQRRANQRYLAAMQRQV
jgi:uncharacterized protein (UPF0548 family)